MPSSPPPPGPNPAASPVPGVLLVDDEEGYLDLLGQLLGEHLDCPVHCFTRSVEALEALPRLEIGLIVTDYHMPGLNGLEFLVEVRKRHLGIPAVMITAHGIELTLEWTTALPNLKSIVKKPFRWVVLAEEISRHWPGSKPPFDART